MRDSTVDWPKRPPKVIATDLDGTLLRSDDTISSRTQSAIRAARSQGVHVILVTARPPRSVRWIANQLGVSGLAICSNGAIIYDLASGALVRNQRLSATVALEVAASLRAHAPGFAFAAEHGHRIDYEQAYPMNPGYIHVQPPIVDALEALCGEGVTKLLIHHPKLVPDEVAALAAACLGDRAAVTHSGAPYVEVCAPGVSKAAALADLCLGLDCTAADVAAFGDMPNDLPMLIWAGRAIAVANAHPSVLAVAHHVTASNDDDGVAEVIEDWIAGR